VPAEQILAIADDPNLHHPTKSDSHLDVTPATASPSGLRTRWFGETDQHVGRNNIAKVFTGEFGTQLSGTIRGAIFHQRLALLANRFAIPIYLMLSI